MVLLNLDNPELAKSYDDLSDTQFHQGCALVERLGVKAGDRVLDIGCGTGRLGFHVLQIIGPSGRFTGIDPLPARVAIANAKNSHPNARFLDGRAEDLSFVADASMDVVYLSAVFHWVADKEKALRESRRVLRPGGRVGITTSARELMVATTLHQATTEVFKNEPYRRHVRPEDMAMFADHLTTTELIEMLARVGLAMGELHVEVRSWEHASGREAVRFLEASSFGNYLARLPDGLREQARNDLVAEFDRRRVAGRVQVDGYGMAAIARKVA
jgi:ubiquinone/menaquinone biosynthesis C-methylase UbiE